MRQAVTGMMVAGVLSAALSWGAEGAAGSVAGRTVDARTGRPLAGVIVVHEPSGRRDRSDASGRFHLDQVPPGRGTLGCSLIGYGFVRRAVLVSEGEALEVTVPLAEGAATYSEEVTVGGDVFPTRDGAPGERTLAGAALQDLRGVLTDDPLRAVQVMPGVSAPDDFHSVFSVRGSPFRSTGFVLDGVQTPVLLHTARQVEGGGSVTMLSGDVLAEVVLRPGAHPQRYGNRTGAQIDLTTRDGSRDHRKLQLAVSGSSASAIAEGPWAGGRGSWLLSGRKSYTELLFRRIFDDDSFAFGFADGFAKLVWAPSTRQQLQLGVLAGRSVFSKNATDLGSNEARRAVQTPGLGYLGWRFTSAALVVQQRVFVSGARFLNRAADGAELDRGSGGELGWRGDVAWVAEKALTVEAGAQLGQSHGSLVSQRHALDEAPLGIVENFGGRFTSLGAYAQFHWSPRASVTVTPGARFDSWGVAGAGATSPWLQAEWRAGRATVRLATGIERQAPDLEAVIGRYGNPSLRPESARHADLVLEHRPGEALRWQVALFERQERDLLVRPGSDLRKVEGTLVVPAPDAAWVNRQRGDARGIEALLERAGPGRLQGWVSYAYLRHRITDPLTGESFWSDFDQRHTFTAYFHARATSRTALGLKLRGSSNAPIPGYWEARRIEQGGGEGTLPGFEPPVFHFVGERRNELRLPFYARLDLRASHTRPWGRAQATLFAEVVNALDRDNRRPGSPSVDRAGRVDNLTESLFPLVPSVGVLLEF